MEKLLAPYMYRYSWFLRDIIATIVDGINDRFLTTFVYVIQDGPQVFTI